MIWANFLHFYQPPTQKPYWVTRITNESYRPILRGMLAHPNSRTTLNINSVLVELWEQCGATDVIDMVRELLSRGQLELTGSAKFHPLLPRIPDDEILRQIDLNTETHKQYFGDLYQPKGFFPPEMGISQHVAEVIASKGFEWLICDELSFHRTTGTIDYGKLYELAAVPNFKIYFRERKMSYRILSGQLGTGNLLIEGLGDRLHKDEYLITAMDGETFGHHRPGMEHLLFEVYESNLLQTMMISDLPKHFSKVQKIDILPSTWALMEKDLQRNVPFARWDDEGNIIHELQWKLTDLAIKTLHAAPPDGPGYAAARALLDRALHSDQFWWASAKPWWSLEMMERGAKELRDVVIQSPGASEETKKAAQELYQQIIFTGFEWQREGIVETLAKQEDEEIRQRTDEGMPKMPPAEIEKIIGNLEKEMNLVAGRQEYERAAQLRDRIKELRTYAKTAGHANSDQ
ncbi:MAG: UvrB/UvrC motif-containing protein [Candidatus Kerfeldbacteria bacterium]|nr:UvrB/UvrC motif-containing protein [Candidatus Kerfeldbacteria bacterium]